MKLNGISGILAAIATFASFFGITLRGIFLVASLIGWSWIFIKLFDGPPMPEYGESSVIIADFLTGIFLFVVWLYGFFWLMCRIGDGMSWSEMQKREELRDRLGGPMNHLGG